MVLSHCLADELSGTPCAPNADSICRSRLPSQPKTAEPKNGNDDVKAGEKKKKQEKETYRGRGLGELKPD